MSVNIRLLNPEEHRLCDNILRALPDWFGVEQALVNYVREIQSMQTWIIETDNQVAGFLTLNRHNAHSAEIQVMAVAKAYHGRGFGRQLIDFAEQLLRAEDIEFFEVKTLAPSAHDPNYERTRGFYKHMGFKPLEENLLWGKANPCLIMVKHIKST